MLGLANLNKARPISVNGSIIVIIIAKPLKINIRLDGLLALNNGFLVLIENKNTNSVKILAINQFVCKTSGEIE